MKRIANLFHQHPYLCVFVLSFLIRILFLIPIQTMSISGDEIFSFWPAAKLAGMDWSGVMEGYRYYGFGYTLLLTPFFLLIHNPVVLYKCLVILMIVFQSAAAPICAHLLKTYLGIQKDWNIFWISMVISFMVSLRAVYTYPEFLYDFLIWLIAWLLIRMSVRSTLRDTIFLWLVTAYACTVHSRGITLVCAILAAALVYRLVTKKNLIHPWATLVLAVFAVLFYQFGISLLLNFLGVSQQVGNVSAYTGSSFLSLILHEPKSWISWLTIIIGQLNEGIMMSFGLAVPVVWVILRSIFSANHSSQLSRSVLSIGVFSLVAVIITIGGQSLKELSNVYSAMFEGGNWDAFRMVTYLRYYAAYTGPLMMIGLVLLKNKETRTAVRNPWLITSAILQGAFVFLVVPYINHYNGSVWSYAPFWGTRGFVSEISTAAYLAGTFLMFFLQLFYMALNQYGKQSWVLPVAAFGMVYVYGYNCLNHEGFRSVQNYEAIEPGLSWIQENPAVEKIYVENAPAGSAGQGAAWLYQYNLPNLAVEIYNGGAVEDGAVVISSQSDLNDLVEAGFQSYELSDGWFLYERTDEE